MDTSRRAPVVKNRSTIGLNRGGALKVMLGIVLACAAAGVASAQTPVAVDDFYNARSGFILQVEAPGVMENDHDGGGEPPPSQPAAATLDSDVSNGLLVLYGDGSFDYTSNAGFSGIDTFTYHFVNPVGTSNTATVSITVDGCEAGVAPTQWVCWVEEAYLAKVVELGLSTFVESFESDADWGMAREPAAQPSIVSQGVTWASNHSFNGVSTGPGPARGGLWGFFSDPHGDTSGLPGDRIYDGFTAAAASPDALLGVGAWLVASQLGARIDLIVTHGGGGTTTVGFPDNNVSYTHEYFGFIDTAGFTSFEVMETDGTVNQPYYIFGDDFTFAVAGADTTPPTVTGIASWEDTGDGVLSEGESTDVDISELTVRFSEPVWDPAGDTDPDDVTNPANYLLFSDGGDGFDTVDCAGGVAAGDTAIAVELWEYVSGNPSETLLFVNGSVALPIGSYRLLVCGTTSIIDWAANPLDGDGNGTGGDDFVRNFEITAPINDPPTADPQSVSTPEDTALGITLTGSDPDGDALTYAIGIEPIHGVLTWTPPNVTYTPGANYHGPDSFTFTVNDGFLTSPAATVSITVNPVNDPPTADDQSVSTPEDTALLITLTGGDVDGDTVSFVLGAGPSHGVLTNAPPNVTYTPDPDYHGPDSFSFTTTDGVLSSLPATVSITVTPVNDTPLAGDDSASTDEDVAISIAVLTNDDLGDEPTTITSVTQGTSGAVTIDPGATSVTYTPNADFHGGDSFTYTITDVDLETSTATVSMTMDPINDAPVADAGPDQTAFVTDTVTLDGSGSSDVDGDPLTFAWTITSRPLGSAAALSDPTAVMPTFDIDLPGNYVAELIVWDGTVFSAPDTVLISTTNSAPVADPQSVSTPEDTALGILLTGSDADGDPITFEVMTGPTHGVLTGVLPNLTYTPDGGYSGPDAFEFRAFDGLLYSIPATIAIDVTPVANPVLTIDDASIVEPDTGTATVTLAINISEPSPVSISVDFATADGSAVANLDYVEDSGTLTIPALSTSYDLTVEIIGDLVFEPDETFFVNLSNPVGATLGAASTATVTIFDNDPWTWYVATDGNDANDCLSVVTACETISEAVSRATAGDLINVARGVYLEHLVLGVDLTLEGELPRGTVIDGGGAGVVIDISPATTVSLRGFEIRNGAGGGIANQGDLTLEDSWVHDNGDDSTSTFGGLSNLGTALIDRVAITANHGHTAGGVSNAGQLEIRNSTISGNSAGHAPGIDNLAGAALELVYSTVAANGSHGIRVGGGASLRGTIIAGHTAANCDAAVNTLGHNLEDADTCGLQTGSNDLIGTDPLLAPLGFHGGSSPTHAIDVGSPAVDAGESTGAPATDQRGVIRPIDGDLDGSVISDIGAFEFVPGLLFTDGFESGDTSAWN